MASRSKRASIALETVAIVHSGSYASPAGGEVVIREGVEYAIRGTKLITPGEFSALRKRADGHLNRASTAPRLEVRNETTLSAARRLVGLYGAGKVAALNFASAKNPGGGFLNGSQAQEESLSRASALYACLQSQRTYYDANRAHKSSLYTDHLIASPMVPVFRNDEDELLNEPFAVTIITSPAPNAGAIETNEPESVGEIESTFRRRIEKVLLSAVAAEQTAIVLGAWGCGVFRNDPAMVAELFADQLLNDGLFARAFDHVAFAVLDRSGNTFNAFAAAFGESTV